MRMTVVASVRFAALHHWPDAAPPVEYLRHPHRHEFHVTVWKDVTHGDREVEVIQLKLAVKQTLAIMAPDGHFGSRSCENIAAFLLLKLGLSRCSVLEDGENGAEVWA